MGFDLFLEMGVCCIAVLVGFGDGFLLICVGLKDFVGNVMFSCPI